MTMKLWRAGLITKSLRLALPDKIAVNGFQERFDYWFTGLPAANEAAVT